LTAAGNRERLWRAAVVDRRTALAGVVVAAGRGGSDEAGADQGKQQTSRMNCRAVSRGREGNGRGGKRKRGCWRGRGRRRECRWLARRDHDPCPLCCAVQWYRVAKRPSKGVSVVWCSDTGGPNPVALAAPRNMAGGGVSFDGGCNSVSPVQAPRPVRLPAAPQLDAWSTWAARCSRPQQQQCQ